MRPTRFDYIRPETVEEAIEVLNRSDENKALAGGHSLIPALNLRLAQPKKLVDISRLPGMDQIRADEGKLQIGALCTHHRISHDGQVADHCPALADAASIIGDPQVRQWGTLGGNLAHADPASDPPIVSVACSATIHCQGPSGKRSIAADDFFKHLFTTDLKMGELITHVEFPSSKGMKSSYVKLPHPASRYALVGVCVVLEMEGTSCRAARVGVGGLTPAAKRGRGAEQALQGSSLDDSALEKASKALRDELEGDELIGDFFAPADYRLAMCGVFLKRAVRKALGS